jgi:hypothetical protein
VLSLPTRARQVEAAFGQKRVEVVARHTPSLPVGLRLEFGGNGRKAVPQAGGRAAGGRAGRVMQDGERRARIMAAVMERGAAAGTGELMRGLCRFAVEDMALSGCALVLMSSSEGGRVLAGAGPQARTITRLQAELGEGPCLQAYSSGVPVLLPDLAAEEANQWPTFQAAALAAGLHSEFSLPLGTVRNGIGTLDLCRDTPGMLSDDQLSDALAAAGIVGDVVLTGRYAPGGLEDLLAAAGIDRLVVHQATGMIAAQLGETMPNALARLRVAAFTNGRSMYDLAQDVVERRVRFDE